MIWYVYWYLIPLYGRKTAHIPHLHHCLPLIIILSHVPLTGKYIGEIFQQHVLRGKSNRYVGPGMWETWASHTKCPTCQPMPHICPVPRIITGYHQVHWYDQEHHLLLQIWGAIFFHAPHESYCHTELGPNPPPKCDGRILIWLHILVIQGTWLNWVRADADRSVKGPGKNPSAYWRRSQLRLWPHTSDPDNASEKPTDPSLSLSHKISQ